ncbi:hypothetical protein [Leuconostoc fallax]|nr:hypothetical protein [Leuconostoc fallax]
MIFNRAITVISKKAGQLIELVLLTILIDIILGVPPFFAFIDMFNVWFVLLSIILGGVISYLGYRYLAAKTNAIFERINLKK